ncbi:hypothetical protein M1D34_03530 [Ensifer sp. D2-11]
MSAVPVWIQTLQALLAPTIAIAVGAIGYLQWRTAHQKVVLDLFERRYRTVQEIEEIVRFSQTNPHDFSEFDYRMQTAVNQARFLFGDDVVSFLRKRQEVIYDGMWSAEALHGGHLTDVERTKAKLELKAKRKATSTFRRDLYAACDDYMRMNEKRIRTPSEWFRYRNRVRLSYADEHQR